MASRSGGPGRSRTLSQESQSRLAEGISMVFSRWTALQMAIENEWGGSHSRQKSLQLVSDIVAWFAEAKVPHCIDDVENILDESMVLSFNTEIEDGSIEKVAEQLMSVHEECLQGIYEPIEILPEMKDAVSAVLADK